MFPLSIQMSALPIELWQLIASTNAQTYHVVAQVVKGLYKYGKIHRDNDKPAVIWADSTQEWWSNGMLHRDSGMPAIVCANGYQEWWQYDERIK